MERTTEIIAQTVATNEINDIGLDKPDHGLPVSAGVLFGWVRVWEPIDMVVNRNQITYVEKGLSFDCGFHVSWLIGRLQLLNCSQ